MIRLLQVLNILSSTLKLNLRTTKVTCFGIKTDWVSETVKSCRGGRHFRNLTIASKERQYHTETPVEYNWQFVVCTRLYSQLL